MLESFGLADPLKATGWKDDITTWPAVDLGKIFHYILENKAFEADYVGQYKVKKAYSYFKSGFVAQIVSLVLTDGGKNIILLKSSVLPSQKVSSAEHTVWVLAEKCGDILTAYCSCTAGLSQCCNHVIGVLYKVEYAVTQGLTNPTCTEVKCKLNDRSTRVIKGCKVRDMVFEKHDAERKSLCKRSICSIVKTAFDPRLGSSSKISERAFFEELRNKNPTASVLMSLADNTEGLTPLPLLQVAEMVLNEKSGEPYEALVDHLLARAVLTDAQLSELEKMTHQQSQSSVWYSQRIGRLTASCHLEADNKQLILPLFTFTTPIPHYPLDLGNISYSFKFNIQYLGILISVISVIVCNCCICIVNCIGSNSVSCLL